MSVMWFSWKAMDIQKGRWRQAAFFLSKGTTELRKTSELVGIKIEHPGLNKCNNFKDHLEVEK